jgi:hypothetical protein
LLSKNIKIKIHITTILPLVLYGCETWWLTLREERRLRVYENRVMRRIFGPKKGEVTGEWRKLLLTQYCSGNKIAKNEVDGACGTCVGGGEVCTGFWCGNLRERDHLEDPGVDGTIILRLIFRKWSGGMDWTDMAQDKGHVAGFCQCGNEPSAFVKCGEFF